MLLLLRAQPSLLPSALGAMLSVKLVAMAYLRFMLWLSAVPFAVFASSCGAGFGGIATGAPGPLART